MLGAGVGESAAALFARCEVSATRVDGGQFPAHHLHDGDAEIGAGADELLELWNVDQRQGGVFERDGGRIVRLAAEGAGEAENASGPQGADEDFDAVVGENRDATLAGADEESAAAGISLAKDRLPARNRHNGGKGHKCFHQFRRQLEGRDGRDERD